MDRTRPRPEDIAYPGSDQYSESELAAAGSRPLPVEDIEPLARVAALEEALARAFEAPAERLRGEPAGGGELFEIGLEGQDVLSRLRTRGLVGEVALRLQAVGLGEEVRLLS